MRRIKDKILPSAIFVALVLISFAYVHSFNVNKRFSFRKDSIWSQTAAGSISTTKIYGLKVPIPLPLNTHRSIKTEMTTAIMDSAVVSSFASFVKGSISNLRGISISSVIASFRAEVSREVAILVYASMKRKAVFLFHPLALILLFYSLTKLAPIMIGGMKKVKSTTLSIATDFSVLVGDARKKSAERSAAARLNRQQNLALAAAAAATASVLKKEKDQLAAVEKAKKLAIAKAMKEEDARLATATAKAKAEERARLNIEISEKKMRDQRLAVQQAAVRQEEIVKLAKEKKLQQERETELRLAQVQARKDEQNRLLAEQKAAREASSRAIIAKKEEQLRLQVEAKEWKARTELNLKAEKQALLDYKTKVAEEARQQVLAKKRATEQSRLAQMQENDDKIKREKREREELLAQQLVKKAKEDSGRAIAKAEMDLIQAAERARKVEEERKALAAVCLKKEEDERAAKEMKMKAEKEAFIAIQKEKELQQMKAKSEKMEKKWGPGVLVGNTPEPLPWLQKTTSALSARARVTRAREMELAEEARAVENEKSIAKAKADIEEARKKATALAAFEALEAIRLETLKNEALKNEALKNEALKKEELRLADLAHSDAVIITAALAGTSDALVSSSMIHNIAEGMPARL